MSTLYGPQSETIDAIAENQREQAFIFRTYFIFYSQDIALGGKKKIRLKLIDLKEENKLPKFEANR